MGMVRRLGCLLLGIGALVVLAGCSGKTTGASQATKHPDGSYSAKLNAVGSCDKGSPSTPCTAYMRWRAVGTATWTNGPSVKVDRKVSDHPFSQTAKPLAAKTSYEYEVCGNEFSSKGAVCVGPDGKPGSAEQFVIAGGKVMNKGGQTATAPGATPPASPGGDQGGSSASVAIAIGAGIILVVGGVAWRARKRA